jgi:hypothetical protein
MFISCFCTLNYLRFINNLRVFVTVTKNTFTLMLPFFMLFYTMMFIFVFTFSVKTGLDNHTQVFSVVGFTQSLDEFVGFDPYDTDF